MAFGGCFGSCLLIDSGGGSWHYCQLSEVWWFGRDCCSDLELIRKEEWEGESYDFAEKERKSQREGLWVIRGGGMED